MAKPRLSIGLPVYNGERYLRQAIESMLAQDFTDFELIISDNASTDSTEEICRTCAARDKRVRYLRSETNRGVTWNFRYVLEVAGGEYFKWAAHDDECLPTMLRRCMEMMERADASVVLVYPHFDFIDDNGVATMTRVDPKWDRVDTVSRSPHKRMRHVIWRNYFGQAIYGIVRTEALRRTTLFGRIAPDWIKLAELAMLGKIVEVPEVLFRLRRHEGNSAAQYQHFQELLAWHDPNVKKQAPPKMSYNTAIVMEYFRAVCHMRLPMIEKIMCSLVALTTLPSRRMWFKILRYSGPIRIRLQSVTGWSWLSRTGVSPK